MNVLDATPTMANGVPATVPDEWIGDGYRHEPKYAHADQVRNWLVAAPVWPRLLTEAFPSRAQRDWFADWIASDNSPIQSVRHAAEFANGGDNAELAGRLAAVGLTICVPVWDSKLIFAVNEDGTRGAVVRDRHGNWM